MILAIDPGNEQSAFVLLDNQLKPKRFAILPNEEILDVIAGTTMSYPYLHIAIEMIASYGMAVGRTVFDTCVWIGRFQQEAHPAEVTLIYRKDEKMVLCGNTKAKDANIRQALIDRFGVVGTKAQPGWFYGFRKDIWASYAVAVAYHDLYLKEE